MDIKLNDDEVLVLVEGQEGEENKLPESGYFELTEHMAGSLWGSSMESIPFISIKYMLVKVLKQELSRVNNDFYFTKGEVVYSGAWYNTLLILKPFWLKGVDDSSFKDGKDYSSWVTTRVIKGDNTCNYSDADINIVESSYSQNHSTEDHSINISQGNDALSVTTGEMSLNLTNDSCSPSVAFGGSSMSATIESGSHSITLKYSSPSVTLGDYSHSITMGPSSNSITEGERSHSIVTNDKSICVTKGKNSIACGLTQQGIARCGEEGVIVLTWVDENDKIRVKVGYPGEDGIKPNTYYQLDREGNFVECENEDVFI